MSGGHGHSLSDRDRAEPAPTEEAPSLQPTRSTPGARPGQMLIAELKRAGTQMLTGAPLTRATHTASDPTCPSEDSHATGFYAAGKNYLNFIYSDWPFSAFSISWHT